MMKCCLYLIILLFAVTSANARVDCIEIIKHKRELNLIKDDKIIKSYKISLGKSPKGHKQQEGDNKTPEGSYFVKRKISNSEFHRSLVISYPNPTDRQHAAKLNVSPGGNICIHGLANSFNYLPETLKKLHRFYDWTKGCIAVTDSEIEEIFAEVDVGTPVIIFA